MPLDGRRVGEPTSSEPCGLSRPKALQTQGCDWVLTEYYDRVLRQLDDSRTAKEGHGGLPGPCQYVDGPQKFLAGAPDVAFQLQIARVAAGDQTAAGQP